MTHKRRPWQLLLLGLGATILLIVAAGSTSPFEARRPALPYTSTLTGPTPGLREFDDAVSRGRYVDGGYEIEVKQPGRTTSGIPDTQRTEHQHVEVTIEFRRTEDQPSASRPSAGLICRSLEDGFYDLRLTADGRYAIYRRHRGDDDYRLLATSDATGSRLIDVSRPVRLGADCAGWRPVVLRLFVNGDLMLRAEDPDGLQGAGDAGFIVGSGHDADFAVLFRDFFFRALVSVE